MCYQSGKLIFVLVTVNGVWDVPPKGWMTQDIRVKLRLHGQGKLVIDISQICSNPRWTDIWLAHQSIQYTSKFNPFKCNSSTGYRWVYGDDFVPIKLKADLHHAKLDVLIRILRQPQIDSQPSMQLVKIVNTCLKLVYLQDSPFPIIQILNN